MKRGSGTFVKSTEIVVDDPLGLAQFEDKYRLAMELFEVRMLLEPDVAAVACQKATEEDKKRIRVCVMKWSSCICRGRTI